MTVDTARPTAAPEDRTTEARGILRANDRGGYTVPTERLYPFQWNWDSLFVALGWAEFDPVRATAEIDTLFRAQRPSGMIPHIVFWTEESTYFPGPDVWRTAPVEPSGSGISQPPVAATIVRRLVEAGLSLDRGHVEAIERWHAWWHRARDPEQQGVIAISHPWESGRDNLPDWDAPLAAVDTSGVQPYERRDLALVDAAMRPHQSDYDRYLALVDYGARHGWDDAAIAEGSPFWVADVGISSILLRAERDLAWLTRRLGLDPAAVEHRIARLTAGYEQFWNPDVGAYCSFDLRTGRHADAGTSASFLAAYAGVDARLGEVIDELDRWAKACTYLVPSFDPRHEKFEPLRYWRGPVWGMVNYMIATGLADVGADDWAQRIRTSTHDLILASGMPESFDPMTGTAVGGGSFAWTAAIWLTWAGQDS
ncbi:MAG: trehalase family glycosidase [Actinomycetota bacterium]